MFGYSQVHPETIYRDYRELEDPSYTDIIRFFEHWSAELHYLDFEHYFEIYHDYLDALFETANYAQFLQKVDWAISSIIEHNIFEYRGKDIFLYQIFRKAAALLHIDQPNEALRICKEILRLQPHHRAAKHLVFNCLKSQYQKQIICVKSAGAVLLLLSSVVIFIELMLVQKYAPEHLITIRGIRNVLFVFGLSIIGLTDLFVKVQSHLITKQFVN